MRVLRARAGRSTLLSLLAALGMTAALTMPALADHDPADGPAVTPTPEEFAGGDPTCEIGVAVRFNNPAADDKKTVDHGAAGTATVTILSVANNQLTFSVANGLAAVVKVKGGVSTPGVDDQNVYDYSGLPGGGIAHDDGLINPGQQGISHVDFCVVVADEPVEEPSASLRIVKDADGDEGESFSFNDDLFSLSDGQETTFELGAEALESGSAVITITETIGDEQADDLWSLDDIVCDAGATAVKDLEAGSVTVTLEDGDAVTCTFFNVQGNEGTAGGNPTPSQSAGGELPDTAIGEIVRLPVTWVSVAFLAALGLLLGVRLARQR